MKSHHLSPMPVQQWWTTGLYIKWNFQAQWRIYVYDFRASLAGNPLKNCLAHEEYLELSSPQLSLFGSWFSPGALWRRKPPWFRSLHPDKHKWLKVVSQPSGCHEINLNVTVYFDLFALDTWDIRCLFQPMTRWLFFVVTLYSALVFGWSPAFWVTSSWYVWLYEISEACSSTKD